MNEIIFITPDLSTELPLLYADGGIPAGSLRLHRIMWMESLT